MGKDKTKLLILNTKNTHQPNASWRIASETFETPYGCGYNIGAEARRGWYENN